MSSGGCGGEDGDVAELARGSVSDRPWGRTFAALGLRGLTGQLTLVAEGRRFLVAFQSGAVVAAASPLASDAAVRVALTSHLVSSSQVPEISRRQAAAPERDEIDLIAELARLGPDHALRLRRRVIAQRAARTFSINHGEFVITDEIELAILPGCELDVRAVIYMGARTNLSELRLATELDKLGSRFRLRPALDDDLPQFGFTDLEQPVVERLRDGGSVGEIEEFATSFVDGRTVRAVVYALAVCNACDLAPPRAPVPPARSATPTPPVLSTTGLPAAAPRAPLMTQPGMAPLSAARPPAQVRGTTQRLPTPSEASRIARPAPDPSARRSLTPAPSAPAGSTSPAIQALRQPAVPGGPTTRPLPTVARRPTTASPALATGSTALPALEVLDAPTQRDRSTPVLHLPPDESRPREPSNPAVRRLPDERMPRDGSDPAPRPDRSSPALRPPLDAPTQRDGQPLDVRLPQEASSPAIHRLPEEAKLRDGSDPAVRRTLDEAKLREGSTPALRLPVADASAPPPEPVILRVPSVRPPPGPRQGQRTDSPQSHDVKALIAQRLALLDQGGDHFQLLGVAHDVAPDALRKAYFALARQLHPDRLAALGIPDDGKHAQRLFAQINAGFTILSDPARRAHYLDVVRRGGEAAVRAEEAKTDELTRRILDAEEAFRRGELALRRDQPQAAITELERAIQLNPDEADYHALLAWSQFCAAADKPAIAPATRVALDQAIQRSPRAVTARFYLGRVERMLGRDQEALRHFRDVLSACPGHADAAAEQRVLEARLAGGDKPAGGLFSRFKR
jgi:hypothetical protein